jgi:DNA-binding MarR family transcriptional regulator
VWLRPDKSESSTQRTGSHMTSSHLMRRKSGLLPSRQGCAQTLLKMRPARDSRLSSVLNIRLDTSRYNNYIGGVTQSGKARRVGSPEEAAFLELLRTADMLTRGAFGVLKAEDLSLTQYNVLRILRGSPQGLPCGELASRMITRDPDVTRLLDRMEKRGLISRSRDNQDRRMVLARITPEGLKLVDRLDEPVQKIHSKQLGHLGKEQLRALLQLLTAARAKVE